MASLKKITRSLRKRFLPGLKEVPELRKEIASLREEIARLHAIQGTTPGNGLHMRLGDLEMLLTEHPQTNSRGQANMAFPSPAVSVVMPTWNRAGLISDAIASAQAQTFTDWELIIVDDGSTDETEQIAAMFADDRRIRYVKQPHGGSAKARNHGLQIARGSLIAYLDSDNLWYPQFLSAAVTTFAADPTVESVYGGLISDAHGEGNRILFKPFDRAQLLKANFIDGNAFVHRRSLVDAYGGWDESLDRLQDWDLILRYTQRSTPRRIPVLAARYRAIDEYRISNASNCGRNFFHVSKKWVQKPSLSRPIRVLYILWHYPQLSETYVETEIQCMRRWGVHIEAWSETGVASPYESSVPVHRGTLEEAIAASKPDILHVHWINIALQQGERLSASGLPVTIRAHGFEVTGESIRQVLALRNLRRAFFFPHQMADFSKEPKLAPVLSAFDTTLFQPEPAKDRHLVIRTGAALPSKDLGLFFEAAKRLPQHRFILAAVTCKDKESYVDELKAMLKSSKSPTELMFDVPRPKLADLVKKAAIYLHTVTPPDKGGTPIGMPISIAEAMATGAHVLARDLEAFKGYIGPAGNFYRNVGHAVDLIAETEAWTDDKWKKVWTASVDRAFMHYADESALQPVFNEWCAIMESQPDKSQTARAGSSIRAMEAENA